MYGSTARGDGDRGSDIDLLLVVPDNTNDATWAAQIGGLAGTIRDLTGNHAEIIEYTRKAFRAVGQSGSPFIANLRADGVDLFESSWEQLR